MNSGKVRIYELSRELNLENKDILTICDQLNISVKSHSSTITDEEAERIRSVAENNPILHSSPTKPASQRTASQPPKEAKVRATMPVQKKQQIVAVKSVTRQPNLEAPTPPNTANQPPVEPPARPAVASKPSAPQRPVTPPEPQEAAEAVEAVPPVEVEVKAPEPIAAAPEVSVAPVAPVPPVVPPEPPEAVAPKRDLAEPPQRMQATAPPRTSQASRPILKRPKADQPGGEPQKVASDKVAAGPAKAETPARLSKPPVKAAPGGIKPGAGKQAPTKSADKPSRPQQTIVELRRPKPIRPENEEPAKDAGILPEIDVEPEIETVELKLRPKRQLPVKKEGEAKGGDTQQLQPRPSLPRSKKAKDWDEEEEGKEFAKVGKAGTKTKRRSQSGLDDEDEDLDILLEEEGGEDGDNAAQVNLSLVRPAKPKSARQQAAKPATSAPRTRRSAPPRDRRDRRSQEVKPEKPEKIILTGSLTVQELAELMVVPDTDIIRSLFMKGIMAAVTQTLDIETATMVAQDLGVEVETGKRESQAKKTTEMLAVEDLENLHRRPPVVTIMGHVDHGKTSLLDSIRKTKVAQGEAGGITQHIGAYHVDVDHNGENQQIVFLDTPGHEAFTAMRARGARVTDIAILVVAADDGVQPQTIEAISHAKAAEVPIVVAINKVDKEGAQPERVKQELTEFGLVPEEWGGETIMVPVSAITGENLDTLLDMIVLVSEVEELSANPDRVAKGTVVEAHLDKAKGPVATLLVQNGTLRVGDVLVAGAVFGKVRAMVDDRGQRVKEAGPSYAVEVLGLSDVPAAGDEFDVFLDEKEARSVASSRTDAQRQSRLLAAMSSRRVSLNTLSAQAQEGELKELNLVLKADVQGSIEAILGAFKQLPQNEVQVRVLYAAPGEISETDIDLAAASSAVIVGFNTTLAPGARQAADRLGVDVRDYNIIYTLLDDIQGAMEGLLEPELVEEPLGQVEVRAVFPVGRGQVAGCYVQSGKVIRNCKVRVRRKGEVIYEGNLDSLKRMREDAREVATGFECGIGLDSFNSWELGDIIEAYRMITKRRTLSK